MSDYAAWWHERSGAPGVSVALEATLRSRSEHGGRLLEVLDHERFGRLVALDGALVHVEEDAAWREMLVHVPLGAIGDGELRVLVAGDPAIAAEALRRDDVASVEVQVGDPALFAAWADAVGLDVAADPRLRLTPGDEPIDVAILPQPAALPPGRLDARGVAVVGDAVILEKRGPRWLRDPPPPDGLRRIGGRWFAMSPLAPGGFYGFTAHAAVDQTLDEPRRAHEGRHYNAELHRAAFALPAFFGELT